MEMSRIDADKILNNVNYLNNEVPVHLNIDLTGICNQKCIWCFFKGGIDENTDVKRDQDLRKHIVDTFKVLNVIKDFADHGGKAITFVGGGEPLMHPDALLIILQAQLRGIKTGLITNLSTKLNNNLITVLSKMEFIRVSLDASTRDTYKFIHGVDHFDKVISNMKRIRPKTLGISFLVHRENYEDIRGIFEIAGSVCADYVQFKPVYQNEKELEKLPTIGEIEFNIKNSKGEYTGEILNEYESRLKKLWVKSKPYPYVKCQISKYRIHIGSDGNIYPCCIFKYSEDYSYGSFYEQPLLGVLNSEQREIVEAGLFINECPMCWDKDCQVKLSELDTTDLEFV
jgi:radical SAM protein with 4Fe4S-binding SPASM domain